VKLAFPAEEEYVGQVEEGLTREGQQVEVVMVAFPGVVVLVGLVVVGLRGVGLLVVVVVSKYPVELLEQRKKAMEENVLRQKANLLEQEKARALDVIWRYA
jgi:hypothetical protein